LIIFSVMKSVSASLSKDQEILWPYCFGPCFKLGELTTKVAREKPLKIFDEYMSFSIGWQGLWSCSCSACLCLAGWPVAPGLGCYVCLQRRYIELVYDGTVKSFCDSSTCIEGCFACITWPCVLRQNYDYLEAKEKEGLLRYDWEVEYLSFHAKRPKIQTQICYVMGPPRVGKTLLFQRLLASAFGSENVSLPKIRVGSRSVSTVGNTVKTLEVWDVPFVCQDLVRMERNHVTLLLFDCTVEQSLVDLMDLARASNIDCNNVIVVGMKEDVEEARESIGNKALLFGRASEWAQSHGYQLMGVAAFDNASIANLFRVIRDRC